MPKASPNLRRLRHERDRSAAEVAVSVRSTEGNVRNVENGTTTASWRLLYRFARLYEVPVEDLVVADESAKKAS